MLRPEYNGSFLETGIFPIFLLQYSDEGFAGTDLLV